MQFKNFDSTINYFLELSFASNLKISRYNQTRVTNSPKAPYHSIYFGAPFSAPSSIKSKSKTKFRDAITTTNKLIPILNKELLVGSKKENPAPKKNSNERGNIN